MKTRWVVLKTPWWQCVAAGVPFLVDWAAGERWAIFRPEDYKGPEPGERDVVVAPHKAPRLAPVFESFGREDRIVLYETENLLGAPSWRAHSETLRSLAPSCRWWNYSARNALVYGDTPRPLRRLLSAPRPSQYRGREWGGPDVLFVGSMNQRRAVVLDQLAREPGVKVHVAPLGTFGRELAYLESYSRILLNIHYYTPGIFESFRVVPAVHRGTHVISERSAAGEGADWCPCVDYDDLVPRVLAELASNPKDPQA